MFTPENFVLNPSNVTDISRGTSVWIINEDKLDTDNLVEHTPSLDEEQVKQIK